jgi:hypothetical protein
VAKQRSDAAGDKCKSPVISMPKKKAKSEGNRLPFRRYARHKMLAGDLSNEESVNVEHEMLFEDARENVWAATFAHASNNYNCD